MDCKFAISEGGQLDLCDLRGLGYLHLSSSVGQAEGTEAGEVLRGVHQH